MPAVLDFSAGCAPGIAAPQRRKVIRLGKGGGFSHVRRSLRLVERRSYLEVGIEVLRGELEQGPPPRSLSPALFAKRALAVDWLSGCFFNLGISETSFYSAVDYLDVCLAAFSEDPAAARSLELTCIAVAKVAVKFNERFVIDDVVLRKLGRFRFDMEQIAAEETRLVSKVLCFDLARPLGFHLLVLLAVRLKFTTRLFKDAAFFLEIALFGRDLLPRKALTVYAIVGFIHFAERGGRGASAEFWALCPYAPQELFAAKEALLAHAQAYCESALVATRRKFA